ncbi:argininosuccinate lyase [Paracoccus sp. SCSIO 75233]|nr:argininosuccinate lyase [Paracoccus sp. SCSIO 75233]WBU53777.1 argininosuccinate lyase [Paracoccus sp. SCSIO 75233]
MRYAAVIALLALAACGVDGAPERPAPPPGAYPIDDGSDGVRANGV